MMKVTTQDIGAFLRALGEQMVKEPDVCAGAILDTPTSRQDIVKHMSERAYTGPRVNDYFVPPSRAKAIVSAANDHSGDTVASWWGVFGDIELPG